MMQRQDWIKVFLDLERYPETEMIRWGRRKEGCIIDLEVGEELSCFNLYHTRTASFSSSFGRMGLAGLVLAGLLAWFATG